MMVIPAQPIRVRANEAFRTKDNPERGPIILPGSNRGFTARMDALLLMSTEAIITDRAHHTPIHGSMECAGLECP